MAAVPALSPNVGPLIKQQLEKYGLEDMAHWLSLHIMNNTSEAELNLLIRDHPSFQQRFWMIFEREKQGLPPISPDEVLAYEATASQVANAFGITMDKRQVGELIAHDVSATEMQERVGIAATAVFQSPPETRAALNRLYGVTAGDLVNYWLDPKKTAPVLQRRFTSAQIAAEAERVGFATQLSSGQAEGLFESGLTADSARQGFGQLVEIDELFESVDQTEQDIDIDSQLRLLTGDVDLAQQVSRRGERRAARFQEGGGFASGREGVAGLGSASK